MDRFTGGGSDLGELKPVSVVIDSAWRVSNPLTGQREVFDPAPHLITAASPNLGRRLAVFFWAAAGLRAESVSVNYGLIWLNAIDPSPVGDCDVRRPDEAMILTINGRPIALEEYRRHRRRRSDTALWLSCWAVLITVACGVWLLI